jgi:hypothetical protein
MAATVQVFKALVAFQQQGQHRRQPVMLAPAPSAESTRPSAAGAARRLGGVSLRSKVGVLGRWVTNL